MQRQRPQIIPLSLLLLVIIVLLGILSNGVRGKETRAEASEHQEGHDAKQHGHNHDADCGGKDHSHEHGTRRERNADGTTTEEGGGDENGARAEEAASRTNIRRHPVHIYKGAERWRPLSNAVPFGVGPIELSPAAASVDEEETEEEQPAQLANAGPSNNDVPAKVSVTLNGGIAAADKSQIGADDQLTESVITDQNEGEVKRRSRNGLHESLRRPLKRLTDRQLTLLLKQIRKQRREQFGQKNEVKRSPSISTRQELLDQLQNLLKQPQDGQRLIRPRLLTNVNILPNEWHIYPAPRNNVGLKKGNESDGEREQKEHQQEVVVQEQQQLQQHQAVHTIAIGAQHGPNEAVQQQQNGVEVSSTSSSSPSTDSILTQPQFELKATIRPPIVQSVVLVSESEQTTAATVEQQQKLETDQHQQQQEEEKREKKDKEAAKLEASWQMEEQKLMGEMRTAVQKADSAMQKLEETKRKELAAEQATNGQNETQRAVPSTTQNLSAKLSSDNDKNKQQTEFKVVNVSHFAEQERTQLGELSAALREIRLRYETVKHEFQSKMKRMGLAHRFKTPSPFKAAGTTTFIEEEAQNGTDTGHNLDDASNKTAPNVDNVSSPAEKGNNGTIGNATDGIKQNGHQKHEEEEPTTAVPIPNAHRDTRPTEKQKNKGKNERTVTEEEQSSNNTTLSLGKTKPKLTLAELADELEQIERTIATRKGKEGLKELETESGTLQKAKKISQKGKKAKQKSRARVSSSFSQQPKGEGSAQTAAINKIVEKIKLAAIKKEEQKQQVKKKSEKQQQDHKNHGTNNSELGVKTDTHQQTIKPTQQSQAVQQPQQHLTIPFVKMTAKSRISLSQSAQSAVELNKLKPVLVDTSTENDEGGGASSADAQHQLQQRQQQVQQNQRHHHPDHHYQQQQHKNNQFDQQREAVHSSVGTTEHHHQHQQMLPLQQHQAQLVQPHQQQQQFFHQQHLQSQNGPSQQHNHHQQRPVAAGPQQHQPVEHQQQHVQQLNQQQLTASAHAQRQTGTNVATAAPAGGFYQLERAQVANVSQKTPKPFPSSELKLKGVAQLAVGKGTGQQREAAAELSNSELSNQLHKEWLRKNGTKLSKEDDDLANLEEFARIDEQAICDAIACNFETGTLCEWESSIDELNPGDPRYRRYMMARTVLLMRRRRSKRNNVDETVREEEEPEGEGEDERTAQFGQNLLVNTAEPTADAAKTKTAQKKMEESSDRQQPPPAGGRTVQRSWHNWVGRYRNRLTGIAQSEVFSTRNQRFAASYLKPGQRSTMTGRLLTGDKATIRFKAWEATRSLQLRVCCDQTDLEANCVFSTELGAKGSSRKWTDHLATCPQGTKKIIFECRNQGPFQGACGVDNIQLVNSYCPSVTPMKANRKFLKK